MVNKYRLDTHQIAIKIAIVDEIKLIWIINARQYLKTAGKWCES